MSEKPKKLSIDPYKGVRDFYPEDMAVRNYIFKTVRETVESFGYREYDASVLEPAELYRAKSGDEIVNEQMYIFTDRGGREVAIRPEMTPTVARMVAGKRKELSFPLRWYSIPNLFRYERPQRGRLREHWQLNVDYFGKSCPLFDGDDYLYVNMADAEILEVAHSVMHAFGFSDEQFEIHVNSRIAMEALFRDFGETEDAVHRKILKAIDQRAKNPANFIRNLEEIYNDRDRARSFASYFDNTNETMSKKTEKFRQVMSKRGINNVVFDANIARGFDYYTGMVFEVFDTGNENNRSLFGGGRYDRLLEQFGGETVPAVGFGMGDVTLRDMLETYKKLPKKISPIAANALAICIFDDIDALQAETAQDLARKVRRMGLTAQVSLQGGDVRHQEKKIKKDGAAFVVRVGEEEANTKLYRLKTLATGEERTVNEEELIEILKEHSSTK